MKSNIHPTWYNDCKVTCACGSSFVTGSILPMIKVDICSKCHPLYTGQQKYVDTLGQVERFQQKTQKAAEKIKQKEHIMVTRRQKIVEEKKDKPSLRDLLMQARKNLKS